jgi:hypothetical protein
MDRSRKENREGHEKTFQYKSRQEKLLDEELIEDKLVHLLAFIGELEQTHDGAVEIQCRVKLFGGCKRGKGETSAEFYPKLRQWLDRDMPRTKAPRSASRQSEEV